MGNAAQQGDLNIVKVLLLNGAKIDMIPESGMTAFLASVASNHYYVAEYLILNGADIDQRDIKDNGALHYAVAFGYYYMSELLLFYKANIEIVDYHNKTPLFTAVKYNDYELTDLLLSYGANVDTSEEHGFTPLMLAAENGYDTIVNMLLDVGADIDKKNNCNISALALAVKNGNTHTVKLLLKRGANINQQIKPSESLISLAKKYNQDSIKIILKEYGIGKNLTPGIEKVLLSYNYYNGNATDYMMGFEAGVKEAKTQLEFSLGINFRVGVRGVLADVNNVNYQFWENRSYINLGIDRCLINYTSSLEREIGLFAGAHLVYTYGHYRGSDIKTERGFYFMPEAGIFYNNQFLSYRFYYSYLDMNVYDISPNRFNLSVIINFDTGFFNQNKYECERNTYWEL